VKIAILAFQVVQVVGNAPLVVLQIPSEKADQGLGKDLVNPHRFSSRKAQESVWLFELSRGTATRFTFHAADETTPLWSPDGKSIVFTSSRDGPSNLYQKGASGTRVEEPLLVSSVSKYPTGWSSDRRHILFANLVLQDEVGRLEPPARLADDGCRAPTRALSPDLDTFQAQFSPDGRWVAYTSNESKRYEVYVQPFPAGSGRWQISTEGGRPTPVEPRREGVLLPAPDRKLMAVPIRSGASVEPGSPRARFQTEVTGLVDARNHYVVAADEERFLVNTVVEEPPSAPINVVVNWASPSRR
jgi:dipeptidyl aminopeptidase/acylaminoacyl peptidase